ncbi:MAG TPA: UDP-N-acetylmuramoyl-L-alanyl-D-glutamate--2,6-diaminopimelate ligase [Coxiellaceae bacterium]|nr:UDP-N-acetylmuramoyl-L-alanyl-D-glutamate--2,6-diaminopimelate ligase [Coxiellaceae bacterium]
MKISLRALLRDFVPEYEFSDLEITGITSNSRELKPGDVFFAYPGLKADGRQFLKQALAQGAAALVCEKEGVEIYHDILAELESQITIIYLLDIPEKLSEIAARFYDHPSRDMTIVGVTGTNGKTSCTHFIAQVLNATGVRCAVMGTLGNGVPPELLESQFTTADAIAVQKTLSELRAQKVQVVAMEVSSHGLAQHRIDAVEFSIAVFTQLSRDHLDYHFSLEEYAAAKERLFHFASLKQVILNLDDAMGYHLAEHHEASVDCFGYSLTTPKIAGVKAIIADQIELKAQGFKVHVQTPWGEGYFDTPLLGRFNISNLLAVLTVLCVLKQPLAVVLSAFAQIQTVSGRLQHFGGGLVPQVIVDYAHTPDALEKVLSTLREHCRGKLWCVFGCGGDRDRGKRPLMAEMAERFSDYIVLTDDNPRSESSNAIAQEIQQGFSAAASVKIILDRASAIKYAIQNAVLDDMILVAGKGHEEYQIIGNERLVFSDRKQVEQELEARATEK